MGENKDLIIIEQLPIITQKFREIAVAVKEKTALALAMPCTKETKQAVKDIRADLNKDKAELEKRRIAVKNAVMKPYNDMDAVYNKELKSVFDETDAELKQRIAAIEDAEKADKEANVRAYFAEYAASLGLDVPYEAAKLNVTLTATEKALKDQAKAWLDKCSISIESIGTLGHSAEIIAEFKANGYNAMQALKTVTDRYDAIEREKQRLEAMKQHNEQVQEVVAKVEAVLAPVVAEAAKEATPDPSEIMAVSFTVTATRAKLRALREYMGSEGINYV